MRMRACSRRAFFSEVVVLHFLTRRAVRADTSLANGIEKKISDVVVRPPYSVCAFCWIETKTLRFGAVRQKRCVLVWRGKSFSGERAHPC